MTRLVIEPWPSGQLANTKNTGHVSDLNIWNSRHLERINFIFSAKILKETHTHTHTHTHIYIYIYIYICVCVCVCVYENQSINKIDITRGVDRGTVYFSTLLSDTRNDGSFHIPDDFCHDLFFFFLLTAAASRTFYRTVFEFQVH